MIVPMYHDPRNPGSLELISTWEPGSRPGNAGSSVAGAVVGFRFGGIPFLGVERNGFSWAFLAGVRDRQTGNQECQVVTDVDHLRVTKNY